MNLAYLSQTAQSLAQPTAAAAAEFAALRDSLAAELNQQMSARPDLEKLIGPDNLAMMHWLIVNIPSFVQLSDAQQAEPLPAGPRHDLAGSAQ